MGINGNQVSVFLAWSGEKSKKVATVFHGYLPELINAVKPYMSEEDVEKGTKWREEISNELQKAEIGILCLTPENVNSNWIHFEAGVLSKQIGKSYVCPFVLGIKESNLEGPLDLFQATEFEKEDLLRMLQTINRRCFELSSIHNPEIEKAFNRCWEEIEESLNKIMGNGEKEGEGGKDVYL